MECTAASSESQWAEIKPVKHASILFGTWDLSRSHLEILRSLLGEAGGAAPAQQCRHALRHFEGAPRALRHHGLSRKPRMRESPEKAGFGRLVDQPLRLSQLKRKVGTE